MFGLLRSEIAFVYSMKFSIDLNSSSIKRGPFVGFCVVYLFEEVIPESLVDFAP